MSDFNERELKKLSDTNLKKFTSQEKNCSIEIEENKYSSKAKKTIKISITSNDQGMEFP